MVRILVTGAQGFTGRHLVRALKARGDDVHGLVAATAATAKEGGDRDDCATTLHRCDLADAARVREVVRDVAPQRVVHLAAISFAAHADVDAIYRVNVLGTRNLLEALAGSAAKPESVLLASSASIYGNATSGVINEASAPAPPNDYAVSKLAMEYMARLWRDRLPITMVRPFNYSGRGQSENFVIPKIVAHFRRRASVIELGNLDVERDFSDVRTVVDCYVRLLERRLAEPVFNVCSGRGTSLRTVLQLARELSGFSPEVRVNPAFVRSNDPQRLVGSKRALEGAIGPVADIDMRQTLEWMFA
jgi:nucleoside-diphosphate-sugar epimerase